MREKPTYWDSILINSEGFIKSNDGQYFKAEHNKVVKRISKINHYLFLILPICILLMETKIWPNLFMEIFLAVLLTDLSIDILDYRLTRFYPVYAGSHEYDVAHSGAHPRRWGSIIKVLLFVAAAATCVFALLNSYCVMLIRSAFGQGGEITQAAADVGGHYIGSVMETDVIPLSKALTIAEVDFTIANTPLVSEFRLDGQSIPTDDAERDMLYSPIWDQHYFTCEYDVYLPEVRNGSILTMDCGNLHREWTFRISD